MIPEMKFERLFETVVANRNEWLGMAGAICPLKDGLVTYTDDSKMRKGTRADVQTPESGKDH